MRTFFTTSTICLLVASATAQLTLQRQIPMTDGEVRATTVSGDTLFMGGLFSEVSLPLTYGTIMSAQDGVPELWADRPNLNAHDCVSDGNGGWYVAGAFTAFGDNVLSGVANIKGDGSARNWVPDLGAVTDPWSVALHDNWVFFAGTNNISAADTASGTNIGWNVSTNGIVYDMAARNGILYVGGIFTLCNGMSRTKVAAIDIATGVVSNWNVSCNNDVFALHHTDDGLVIGGKFSSLSGSIRNRIGMLDRSTGLALPFDPDVTGSDVRALDQANDTLYIGGDFSDVGGQARDALAAVSLVSNNALAWAPSADGRINGLAVYQDQVIAVGATQFAPGAGVQSFDRQTGGATFGWSAPTANNMESIALSGGQVYIAGDHDGMGKQIRTSLAAVLMSTGEILPWAPVVQSAPQIIVNALEVADGKIFAGGKFVIVNGSPRGNMAVFDLVSGVLDPWDPMANNEVKAIEAYAGRLYVGGLFSTFNGQIRQSIASFERNGLTLTGWAPNPTTPFYDFEFYNDKVYMGTQGTDVPAIDTLSGLSAPWVNVTATSQVSVNAMSELFGNIYFGGDDISDVNGTAREHMAAVNALTGQLTPWNAAIDPNLNIEVSAIASNVHGVYVGGTSLATSGASFWVSGDFKGSLMALDLNTGALPFWHTVMTFNNILSLEATDSLLFVGGEFDEMEMQPRPGLAVYAMSDLTTGLSEAPETEASQLRIWPSPYHSGSLFAQLPNSASSAIRAVDLIDQLGRVQQLNTADITQDNNAISINGLEQLRLASGMYWLRIAYDAGTYSGRLMVE